MTIWLSLARRMKVLSAELISTSRFRPTTPRSLNCVLVVGMLLAWIGTVGFGWMRLTAYENAPGRVAISQRNWPAASLIERSQDRATLVLFAHPRCPCTRATLEELAGILAVSGDRLNACVVFSPVDAACLESKTDIMRQAGRITGVRVLCDVSRHEIGCFGATTSGQGFLYDRSGELRFQGGITASRGHAGGNAGRDAVIAVLDGNPPDRNRTFVFGCALTEDVPLSRKTRS